jgi:hypothetical protein
MESDALPPAVARSGRSMMAEAYNFSRFHRGLIKNDMHLPATPGPGQPAPDFTLPTTDGRQFRLNAFRGKQPVLIQFGSIT